MADIEHPVESYEKSPLLEQLGKAFIELQACKDSSVDKVHWTEIEEHFCKLEKLLKKKSEELESKEKEFEEKEAETRELLAERGVTVASKEQDMLDRVQELKDAATAVISEARANHEPTSSEPIEKVESKVIKVSSYLADTNSPMDDIANKTGENAGGVAVVVKPRPELTQFCQQMDAKGLVGFIMENQKIQHVIREELSVALESATEPALLVLDSLEGFYPSDETTQYGHKGDAALQGMRKSCLMLMGAMAALMARVDPGADHLLNPETKQQALATANEWKIKLDIGGIDAASGKTLEAEALLQLLATFRIYSEFVEEELCELVLAVAQRRQAPELCRSLGLTHKIPGVIEQLVNNGKQIDAVRFIHAFELTESFPPAPLLKTFLKDLRRNSQGKSGNTEGVGGQNDVNARELAGLKAVISCVKEYKLEADYPLDPLQKRVTQLDRSKADKRRTGEFTRHQQKKPRGHGIFRGHLTPAIAASSRQLPPAYAERAPPPYTSISERYPLVGPTRYDIQIPAATTYGQQANDQRLYYYSQDDRVAPSNYNPAPPTYGSYMGGGLQSSRQPYI